MTNTITEENKQRLVDHLMGCVLNGISGREGSDLVDIDPIRAIFAGVLQPPRNTAIEAAKKGTTDSSVPNKTAIGLEFRVKPNSPKGSVRIRIQPQWSHYYAVFPTLEQAIGSNDQSLATLSSAPLQATSTSQSSISASDQSATTEAQSIDDQDELDLTEDEVHPQAGTVILPKIFRRFEVTPQPISHEVELQKPESVSLGVEEIASGINNARSSIAADKDAWHYLGEPKDRDRSLGDFSVLASPEIYEQALQSKKGDAVPLPHWDVSLQLDSVPDAAKPGVLRIRILLSNRTPERNNNVPDPKLEERSLFDARLSVEIENGEIVPFDFLLAPNNYRHKPTMVAKGINCIARSEASDPSRLQTETLPVFKQPYYRTREILEVRFEQLDVKDASPQLEQLAAEMEFYLQTWDRFLSEVAPEKFTDEEIAACATDRNEFVDEIRRYRLGIEALRRDAKLAEAFQLMNRTFGRLAKASNGRITAWRLFQIGFIVSQLPSLAARELSAGANDEYAGQVRETLNEVGILWFPTGGGKTEAYLGLIAVALIYDRLRGKQRGVCSWMRFPMRMLSLQQMERLAKVIAALNQLRAEIPRLQVGDPFAIGYFVGDSVTPNSLSDEDMRRYQHSADFREKVRLLRNCPFCGNKIEIAVRREIWRLQHVCTNEQCFSNTSATLGPYKGSLPVCIVDNEIYRYLPSVLVGTIDKLAIVGRERNFAHLVRGVTQQCPKHGYMSYDQCVERGNWTADCQLKKKEIIKLDPMKDPGPSLLIQDEFHLLRAELGVFNGHYEGLLKYLGQKAFLPAKVLAATATIEAYDVHAFHIYLSHAVRYPKPAWEMGESFYATSKPEHHRRVYVGLLSHTRSVEEPTLRLLGLYMREVRRLKASPRLAADIMKRSDASDEAVLDVLRIYDLSLAYVTRRATGGRLVDKLKQVEHKFLEHEGLGTLTGRLLTSDQTIEDVGATLDRIERERQETAESRLDFVAATNLISHGVDLERINMMLMCGMPSHYAEYVQATSRAARSHPGLVFVCFNSHEPREVSQYEFFPAMHENMDRLIEAVAVNRYASFAPQKTVPGLLAGVLLCDLTPDLFLAKRISKPLDYVPTLLVALGLKPASTTTQPCIDQDYLIEAIKKIIGVDQVYPPASSAQIENVKGQVVEAVNDALGAIGRTLENQLKHVLNPITSFRDVDEGIDFGSIESAGFVTRLSAR